MSKKLKKLAVGVLACLILLGCASMALAAASPAPRYIQVNTWHAEDREDMQAMPDIRVQLHRVADVTVGEPLSFTYTPTEEFSGCMADISQGLKADAEKLYEYAMDSENPVEALKNGTTELADGDVASVIFRDLEEGLYLVSQVPAAGDQFVRYTFAPFLISLPMAVEGSEGDITYSITASPKCEEVNHPIDVVVKKVWKGDAETSFPDSVEVQLSGTRESDTRILPDVFLNEENNWTHTWHDLSEDYLWKVTEISVPKGYEVSYSEPVRTDPDTGNAVISLTITNTKQEPPPLIQTGQLNWPVPVMAVCGIILIIAGCVIGRHGKKEEQK